MATGLPNLTIRGEFMRKISIISISLIILLVFIYVLVRPNPEIVSVSLISETAEITYTDIESMRIFDDAIRTVKKYAGLWMWLPHISNECYLRE